MEIEQKQAQTRWFRISDEDLVLFPENRIDSKIVFVDAKGDNIILEMSRDTFDYIRRKMNLIHARENKKHGTKKD